MIGPIGLIKGYRFHRKLERFRQAMAACGEMAPSRMSDEEIANDLLEQVRQAAIAEIEHGGGRARSKDELVKGVQRLLETATVAAELRASELALSRESRDS